MKHPVHLLLVCVLAGCSSSTDVGGSSSSGGATSSSGQAATPKAAGEACQDHAECIDQHCAGGVCVAASTEDGIKNGSETDVDCGGGAPTCDNDKGCRVGADCASGVCAGGKCAPPSSSDGVKNGTETGPDCGGAGNPLCDDGIACRVATDCKGAECTDQLCVTPKPNDGKKNGNETDVDCGSSGTGPNTGAPACRANQRCVQDDDCDSQRCDENVCAPATNVDGLKNGNETDVDCGHSGAGDNTSAPACADTKACLLAGDCQSAVCTGNVCQVPTATDQTKNGNETDVDCGSDPAGGTDTHAGTCADQKACVGADDCTSVVCAESICQAPTCVDLVRNAAETDTDCGGPSCAACNDLGRCALARDCKSGVCTGEVCQIPVANDGVKNGNETDVDCGSSGQGVNTSAPVCADLKACNLAGDCQSGVCTDHVCKVPVANDGVKNGDETDVDCGTSAAGGTPTHAGACADLKACDSLDDCQSHVCTGAVCQAPTYTDGVKNGSETALDCGGDGARGAGVAPQTRRCVADLACNVDEDCKSGACDQGLCALAKSCTMHHGGDTCGSGDETWPASADGLEPHYRSKFKKHEDCCTSIVVNRPAAQGGAFRMDKYQITAGRMRRFIELLGNGDRDAANVLAYVQTHRAKFQAPAIAASFDTYLPISWNTPDYGRPNPAADCTSSTCGYGWAHHLSGYRFLNTAPGGANGYGCVINPGNSGARTFYLDQAKYRNLSGESQHLLSADRLDEKALTCVDYVMLAAFCAWDGGSLASRPEWDYAWGSQTYPWGNDGVGTFGGAEWGAPSETLDANTPDATWRKFYRTNFLWTYSNLFVLDRYNFPRVQLEPTDYSNDQSYAVAPPGRYPLGAAALGFRDIAGNIMEVTSTGPGYWAGNGSFEGHGLHANWGSSFHWLTKYGRAGGRCMRPISGYPDDYLPKR